MVFFVASGDVVTASKKNTIQSSAFHDVSFLLSIDYSDLNDIF